MIVTGETMKASGLILSLCLLILSLVASAGMASGQDISVTASVDRKAVRVTEVITLTIYIRGIQSAPAPELPQIEGFQASYVGPSTQISIVNNKSSVSVAHRYRLMAIKTGIFTIPSIAVVYQGKTYRTKPIKVQVLAGSGSKDSRKTSADELKKYIRLVIFAKRKTAYVNEGFPLKIMLYVKAGVDVRNIRYPTFPTAGFSVLPFEKAKQREATIDGLLYRVIEFPTTVYPVRSGNLVLGPAEVDCDVIIQSSRNLSPFFDSFFGNAARYSLTVKSDPLTVVVHPLPVRGRPAHFGGAVGQYRLDVSAKPTSLKVGEPITLTMTVSGKGNIDSVTIPRISDLTQFRAYDPQVNVQKSGNSGKKTFEQVLIPKSDKVKAIPKIQFSFFDPSIGEYRTVSKGPIPVDVKPASETQPVQMLDMGSGKTVNREVLGKDIVYIKDSMGSVSRGDSRLYRKPGFLLLQLVPLLGLAGALVYQKRKERFATDKAFARRYQAHRKAKKGLERAQQLMDSGDSEEFYSVIFKTVQEYLGDHFNLPVAGITVAVVEELESRGVSKEILAKLNDFFQAYDRARFARSQMSAKEMKEMLDLATESIEHLENSK